jgi:hypothetical protein
VGTYLAGSLFAFACNQSTVLPGTTRGDVCDAVGDPDEVAWWLAVFWPPALFAASRAVPWLKDHGVAVAVVTVVLAFAFWAPLYSAIGNDILDTPGLR